MRARGGLVLLGISVVASAMLLAPGGAAAATVVNGDFEIGNLNGWSVYRSGETGSWFAYKGDKGSGDSIAQQRGRKFPQPPPQGTYAATSDQISATTTILSQEVVLAPGSTTGSACSPTTTPRCRSRSPPRTRSRSTTGNWAGRPTSSSGST